MTAPQATSPQPYTRDKQVIVDLTMGPRQHFTTTQDYFTKDDFVHLRSDLQHLKETREGRDALADLKEGKDLARGQKELLGDTLGKFANHVGAIKAVEDFVKANGPTKLPDDVLISRGGRPLFQSELRDGARDLAAIEKDQPGTIDALRQIAKGKPFNDFFRLPNLKGIGMLDGREEATGLATYLVNQNEGAAFMAAAGVNLKTLPAAQLKQAAAPALSAPRAAPQVPKM